MEKGPDQSNLEHALFDAFDPFVSRQAPALRRVLLAAFEYAVVGPRQGSGITGRDAGVGTPEMFLEDSQQFIIDKAALAAAIVLDGMHATGSPSTSAWVVDWMKSEDLDPAQVTEIPGRTRGAATWQQGDGVQTFGATTILASQSLIASISMRDRVLPAARDLARRTVKRDEADLRHILFALLAEPADTLGPFGALLTSDRLQRLKTALVKRITATPESGEKVAEWRKLLAPPPAAEAVRTLSDAPALIDSLGRQAFAEVLGARIREVGSGLREVRNMDATFILHMDGPWGSGKSSILNFLKADLESSDPPWLVVEYNAWRNQGRKPPWWPLISHVGQSVRNLPWYRAPKARLIWAWWRIRMRWAPALVTALFLGAFLYFAWIAVAGADAGSRGFPKAVQETVSGVLALVTLGGLTWTTSRAFSFGSANAAEAFAQSSTEPFRRIVSLFERLVRAIDRPVAIFVDDLDRCDSAYVVDLIEGIQTLLRSAPVVYVVAGDRKWICSSFERRYADFSGEIGTPGRPLGFLFLDKVFQLSTSVPQLSDRNQKGFWTQLLQREEPAPEPREREAKKEVAKQEMAGKTRHEDIQHVINNSPQGSFERELLQAEAAKRITSPEAVRAAEHRLQPLGHLLEANPRSMKRLVNAYGLNHARAFLEGRKVSVEALARWTIIELRWPLLADYLTRNWPEIAAGALTPAAVPAAIRDLLVDPDVRAVIGADREKGRLTIRSLKPILD